LRIIEGLVDITNITKPFDNIYARVGVVTNALSNAMASPT